MNDMSRGQVGESALHQALMRELAKAAAAHKTTIITDIAKADLKDLLLVMFHLRYDSRAGREAVCLSVMLFP